MASSLPPRSSYQKKENAGPARREMGYRSTPRRNVLSALNNGEANGGTPSVPADGGGGGAAEAAPVIEFSGREDVERLLAEKMKGKSKNDFKGRVDQMSDYIKKLRACIRWYMELEDGYLAEQEKLRGAMESENTRHTELESQLSNAIKELKATNLDLTRRCESLEESFNKEKSEKQIAVESYEKEKQERESAESSRDVLTVDLERVTHDAKRFSEQLKMVQDTNKRLQEYNTSLQQYNSNLQADASKSGETISKLQKEKSAMMETMAILRESNSSMGNQLESSRVSQQEAIRVKEELRKEVECLRVELKQVRDDRDHSVIQLNSLNIELGKYKEEIGKTSKECESFRRKVSELEETCNTQQEQIRTFQKQLAVATEKLKLADVTAIEAMTGYEEQKEKIKYLEQRLAQAESQIVEGDELRKKLHNTILELKGNIRVFCRVRPLLRFDGDSNGPEGASISFPTSVESTGRGIDLINQGQKLSFSYDKVFDHDASQEDVFVEISQLVQSALDGYKWLAKNIVKKVDKSAMLNSGSMLDKGAAGFSASARLLPQSAKVVRPETSQMIIYDPRQMKGPEFAATSSGYTKEVEDMLKVLSPSMVSFIKNLPAIEGPSPDIDVVLSVLLQSTLPVAQSAGKAGGVSELSGVGKAGLNQNGSVHRPPRERRKDVERQGVQEEEDASTVQSRAAVPRDIFRLRQIQRSRGLGVGGAAAASQSGSSAFSFSGGGSAFSGDHSASTD